jgi:hypothetical protein
VIGHQGGVGQTGASPSDPHGPLQQGHDAGREAIVTGVDGVLALQLQGAFEVGLLRHGLVTASPDGPGDDERWLDPALR